MGVSFTRNPNVLNSHEYIRHIDSLLFTAEARRLEAAMVALHERNQTMRAQRADGFIYQGEFYVPQGTPNGNRTIIQLHPALMDEMDYHLSDRKTVETDQKKIGQVLFKLLHPCQTLQHIRDALPECLTDTLPHGMAQLERFDQPAWTIVGDARSERQYLDMEPRIQFYSAARLLY